MSTCLNLNLIAKFNIYEKIDRYTYFITFKDRINSKIIKHS